MTSLLAAPSALPVNVDMNARPVALKPSVKSRANRALYALGNYAADGVPLSAIFEAVKSAGLIPLQEDGEEWSGIFCGGAECGSDKAREQVVLLPLGVWSEESSSYRLSKLGLCISWGTLYRGEKRSWEFVCYVN